MDVCFVAIGDMDFIIVKINGKDISEANHDQVVEAFRTASSPILVEIVPRKNSNCEASQQTTANVSHLAACQHQQQQTVNGEFVASGDQSEVRVEPRDMSRLEREMAKMQLERLIYRRVEQSQSNHKYNSPPVTPGSQSCDTNNSIARQSDQLQMQTSEQTETSIGKPPSLPLPVSSSSSVRKGPTPPPTPKHFPKPKQLFEKQKQTSKRSSKTSDILPEMQPMEKKESIRRWIRNGIPTTPPLSRKNCSKIGVCQSNDQNQYKVECQKDGFTLQLSPLKRNDGTINSGSMLSLVSNRKETANEDYVLMEDKGTQMQESDVASLFSCESCKRCCRALIDSKGKNVTLPANNRCSSPVARSGQVRDQQIEANVADYSSRSKTLNSHSDDSNKINYVTFHPPCTATMYTNKANLHHTILLQQELLRQALLEQQKAKTPKQQSNRQLVNSSSHQMSSFPDIISSNRRDGNGSISSPAGGHYNASPAIQSGSAPINSHNFRKEAELRYITRRPVRNKLLKERAKRIMQERSGLTTDDDAMSELKVGKYWTKYERKKQLEKAKDRKRKEMMLRAMKMGALREQSEEREVCNIDGAGNLSSGSGNSIVKNKGHFKNATIGSSGSSKGGADSRGSGGHSNHNQFANGTVPSKNRLNELLSVTTV